MLDIENTKNLNLIFKSLPDRIKNWLISPKAQEEFASIISSFNLKEEQELILSRLLLSLVTQFLKPENFVSETTLNLLVDESTAKNITKSLEEKMLAPIADDLLIVGVDIKLLRFNAPSLAEVTSVTQAGPRPSIPLETTASKPLDTTKPFILHEEKDLAPVTETSKTGSSFIFKGLLNNLPKTTETTKVTIERVVHYSNFFTSLNRAPLKYYQKVRIPKSKWFV